MNEGLNAIQYDRPDDLDTLLKTGQITIDMPLLGAAALYNRPECVCILLKHKAKIDQTSAGVGHTPLFISARDGCDNVLRILLQNGANVNEKSSGGRRTALHAAAFWGRVECVTMLISAKANINCADAQGITPIRDALNGDRYGVIRLLVDARCNVSLYDPRISNLVKQRRRTKRTIIAVMGSIRWRCKLGRDMAVKVGRLIWKQRDNQAWEEK